MKQPILRYLFEEHPALVDPGLAEAGVTGSTALVADELVELSHELVRAVQEHDQGRLDAHARRRVHARRRRRARSSREELLEAAAGPYEIEEFAYHEIDPEIYGNTAVVVSRYRAGARIGDRDASGDLRITDVWTRRDGRWQIVRRHATPER